MRISKYGIVLLLIIIFAFIMSCNDDNDEINAYGLTPNFESKIEYCITGGYDVQTNGMIIGYFSIMDILTEDLRISYLSAHWSYSFLEKFKDAIGWRFWDCEK